MSRTKGTFTLTSNIEPKVGAPLDARTIVKLKNDLTANGTFEYPYIGLTVFVTEENKKYTLIGADPTVAANWREEGSGTTTTADHVTYDNTESGLDSTNVQDAIDEIVDDIGNLPSDDTWRSIQVNGSEVQDNTTSSGPLKLVNGTNTSVAFDSTNKTIQVNATDTNTTYTFENGTNSFKVTPSGGTAQTVNVTPSIADATTSASGLMSATDKTKLNGIASGAEVNQNAFSSVKIGSTTIDADAKTDTLELVAGSNIALTPDSTNDKVTIAVTGLGTAAAKNVPSSGNASTTEVVMGDDTRLTDSRNAKDVYSWAKASTKPTYTASEVGAIATTAKGAANGVAELDSAGLVPSSQLPSYVDDVIEVADYAHLPITGESGKIYVTLDTDLTYRWSGTTYVEISKSLALGNTHSTAFYGDWGKTAYDHATETKLSTATASGLYKVASTAQGHIASLTAITKADITALGIPESDTNTTYSLTQDSSDGHKITLTPSSGSAQTVTIPDNDSKVTSSANHYTPATASGQDKSASASGATAAWSIDVVKGVTLNTDGKGHVTGLSVTSGKIPGNPNTDRYVNSASFADDTTSSANSPVKMTLTRAGSDTATVTGNIPKVSSSSAGVAPKGAAVNTQSQTTKFLREDGSWAAPSYTTYNDATTSASGLMSATDKTKLNGIATGAEVNQNAFSTVGVKVGTTTTNVAADSKTDTVTLIQGSNVTLTPDATNDTITIAATDTTYSDATTSASGLMSASDKTKLNGIATGAEVNQNAFSNVKVDSTTVAADSKTDTLELIAGSNVTITPDATNDKITIAATVPTVNNATLTIQKNGTTVKTFTANASTDVTANITVPTKVSELTNDSGYTTNTGTVTSVATGAGLTGGTFTTSGTIKAYMKSETKATYDSNTVTNTQNRQYAVTPDKTGYLSVNVPWENTQYTAATAAPGNIATSGAVGTSTNYARQDHTHGISLATGDANGQVKIAGSNVNVKGWDTKRDVIYKNYQSGFTNGTWYRLFRVSYPSWNYFNYRIIVKCGYMPLYEVLMTLRFTSSGISSSETYCKIITSSNASTSIKNSFRIYQVDDTTFGIAALVSGATSELGFEILDMSREGTVDMLSYMTVDEPFFALSAAPTAFGNHIVISGDYNDLTNRPSLNFLPLSGGTMTGDIIFNKTGATDLTQVQMKCGTNDYGRIAAGATASNSGYLELATADDGNEPIYVRQYSGTFSSLQRTATILDGSGNTEFPKKLTSKIINNFKTGTGYPAEDKGSSADPRYFPARWSFNFGQNPSDGDVICVKLPCAGSDWGDFISTDNGTTYKPVTLWGQGTGRMTTHYGVNSYMEFVYDATGQVNDVFAATGANARSNITGGCWRVVNFYDSNNYERIVYNQPIKAGSNALVSGNIIVGKDGVYHHLKDGTAFDITYPILWCNANTNANATSSWSFICIAFGIGTTQSITLTAYQPVYIKGTLSGTIFTPVSTTPLTQTVPTSEDGYYYIYLGQAYSTSAMFLLPEHKIFSYKHNSFSEIVRNATFTTLLKPIAANTSTGISNWNIPSGSYQVWGQQFSDNRLKYTPSGGSETTVTDTGDWTMWLTGNGTSNAATLNMRIDGTFYATGFNGNLSGNASTATKATNDSDGNAINTTYLKKSGGTMTGQLKTSYNSAVAMGTMEANAHTIPDLCGLLRYSSGVAGSVSITTPYTKDDVTISNGWYNFFWIPHRSGGVNGAASGDNCDYGSLYLSGMTVSGCYMIRFASSNIAELKNLYADTKNTAGSTDTSLKIFLIGATSQAANPQTYSDDQVYVTSGTLQTNITNATAGVNANTANSSTAGGVSLYATDPTTYGIIFRGTGNQGKHGYVQSDWATYLTMNNQDNRGWVFRRNSSGNVASIDTSGRAVFNGSVTVGGNAANTSGARMVYDSTSKAINFEFL